MTTYSQLKNFVAAFAHRDDLSIETSPGQSPMDFFFQLAHNDIEQQLDWQYMETAEVPDTSSAVNIEGQIYAVDLGSDIFQIRSVNVNGLDIQFFEPGALRERFGNGISSGVASAWSVVGNSLWLAPGLGSVLLVAKRRTPAMTLSDDENDIAKYYPNLYVYCSLIHLHRYVQDTEEEMKAQQMFDSELAIANQRARLIRSGATPAMVAV
jgi:hypothetical protein